MQSSNFPFEVTLLTTEEVKYVSGGNSSWDEEIQGDLTEIQAVIAEPVGSNTTNSSNITNIAVNATAFNITAFNATNSTLTNKTKKANPISSEKTRKMACAMANAAGIKFSPCNK